MPTTSNGATNYTLRVLNALRHVGLSMEVLVIQQYKAEEAPPFESWVPGFRELGEAGVKFKVFPASPGLYSFFMAYCRVARELLRQPKRIDVFAFRLAYFHVLCVLVKLFSHKTTTAWFHDGIVEEIYLVHRDRGHYLLTKFFGLLEWVGARFVDWEFPVSRRMLEYSRQRGMFGRRGSAILPCTVDTELFYMRPLSQKAGNETVTIGFAASLAPWQGFEDGCRFLRYVSQELKVKLHVLTSAVGDATQVARRYGLDVVVEWVPHHCVTEKMDQWDFALLPQNAGLITQVCSPLKATEALSKGIPLLVAPNVGDFSAIVAGENVGVVFDPSDPTGWSLTVDAMRAILRSYPDVSHRARKLAVDNFSSDLLVQTIGVMLGGRKA